MGTSRATTGWAGAGARCYNAWPMAIISREEVLHVAELAKLELSEEEVELYQVQLARILEHFRRLQELDTSDVEPMSQVLEARNVLRSDEPRPSLSPEQALANAVRRRDGFFEVPQVLGNG